MRKLLLACACLLVVSLPAMAESEAPTVYGKLKPQVGAWAEYSVAVKKGDKLKSQMKFKISVVGKKGDSLWFEQKMTPEVPKPKKDEASMAMKFLMGKDGVEKAYMKSERGVMDMSGMMSKASSKKQAAAEAAKLTEVGTEKIEVAAGKYKATHYTYTDGKDAGDSWMKPGVGPYGMIKQVHHEGKNVSTMELLASGDGAKSEIDEKTAQSAFGAMMGGSESEEDKPKDGKHAKKPSIGGFFKNALKEKVGLGGDSD